MTDRLPPLTALRAFDAAARHMSFARAADELRVTPAALSFQIKSLEEHLGAKLFHRLTRAVELTEAGRALAPGAQDGFESLTAAWRAAKREVDSTSLTVTAGPAFTAKWLAPRLYDFARAHPDIDLRIVAGLGLMDFGRDDIDVAIRFGYGDQKDLYEHALGLEWLTPMMKPELAAKYTTPEALLNAPLLHNESDDFLSPPCDWPAWFRANGIHDHPTIATRFSQPDHVLDAAVAGAGVALGRQTFAAQELASGRLVAPFTTAISTRARFRFLCKKGTEDRPQIAAFEQWLVDEIEKTVHVIRDLDIIPVEEIASA